MVENEPGWHSEPPDEPELDLDEIEKAYRASWEESRILGVNGMKALDTIPKLIEELREARAVLAPGEAPF